MNILEFKEVTKLYGKKKALNGLTFSLAEKKITGLIGRNGAGKTTILKIAAGFIRPTSGEVRVFHENPFNNLKVSANLIFIDENMNLPSSMTLDEIFETAGDFYPNWDQELASKLLDYFSLHPKSTHDQLSKGMKSTLHAILGLAARCPLTIYDEPTNGMDAGVRKDFYRALLKDYLAYPRTILVSSHHLTELEDLLEDLLLIKEGTKLLHLPVEELRDYAIGISGEEGLVGSWLGEQEVFHKIRTGYGGMYAVVRNTISEEQKQSAIRSGLSFSKVALEDICSFLTDKRKGGIDDVFS